MINTSAHSNKLINPLSKHEEFCNYISLAVVEYTEKTESPKYQLLLYNVRTGNISSIVLDDSQLGRFVTDCCVNIFCYNDWDGGNISCNDKVDIGKPLLPRNTKISTKKDIIELNNLEVKTAVPEIINGINIEDKYGLGTKGEANTPEDVLVQGHEVTERFLDRVERIRYSYYLVNGVPTIYIENYDIKAFETLKLRFEVTEHAGGKRYIKHSIIPLKLITHDNGIIPHLAKEYVTLKDGKERTKFTTVVSVGVLTDEMFDIPDDLIGYKLSDEVNTITTDNRKRVLIPSVYKNIRMNFFEIHAYTNVIAEKMVKGFTPMQNKCIISNNRYYADKLKITDILSKRYNAIGKDIDIRVFITNQLDNYFLDKNGLFTDSDLEALKNKDKTPITKLVAELNKGEYINSKGKLVGVIVNIDWLSNSININSNSDSAWTSEEKTIVPNLLDHIFLDSEDERKENIDDADIADMVESEYYRIYKKSMEDYEQCTNISMPDIQQSTDSLSGEYGIAMNSLAKIVYNDTDKISLKALNQMIVALRVIINRDRIDTMIGCAVATERQENLRRYSQLLDNTTTKV